MEVRNRFLLFAMGVAIIIAVWFDAGSLESILGLVQPNSFQAIVHDVLAIVGYIVGIWLICDAVRHLK